LNLLTVVVWLHNRWVPLKNCFLVFQIFPAQCVSVFMIVLTNSWYQVIADFDATLTKFSVNGTRGQCMLFPQHFFPPFGPFAVRREMNVIRNFAMDHI